MAVPPAMPWFMNEAPLTPPPGHGNDLMVVGLGASAGGLKSLTEFFEHASNDSGIAYVVDFDAPLPADLQSVVDDIERRQEPDQPE